MGCMACALVLTTSPATIRSFIDVTPAGAVHCCVTPVCKQVASEEARCKHVPSGAKGARVYCIRHYSTMS
jgi:hypothetical protein